MSQLDLPISNLVKAVAALTNNHDYVTSIRKKPTSFPRKIEKKSKTNQKWIYLSQNLKMMTI